MRKLSRRVLGIDLTSTNSGRKCMKLYAQFKVSSAHTKILCPLCREDWGPMAIHVINEDCKGKASLRKSCATASCSACTFQIRGSFFRCVECSLFGPPSATSKKNTHPISDNAPRITAHVSSNSQLLNVTLAHSQVRSHPNVGTLSGVVLDEKMTPLSSRRSHAPVDFCQNCFSNISRDHSKHHFLTSSSNAQLCDYMWDSATNPRAPQQLIDAQMLAKLQNRELGDEDYDLLLSLDKPKGITVQSTLVESLPVFVDESSDCGDASGAKGMGRCWCGQETSGGITTHRRLLSCNHICHDDCLKIRLDDALSEGAWKLDEVTCGHTGCDFRLYRGISRRRAKKKSLVEGTEGDGVTGKDINSDKSSSGNSLLSGLLGVGIVGGSGGGRESSSSSSSSVQLATRRGPEAVIRRAGGMIRPPRSSAIRSVDRSVGHEDGACDAQLEVGGGRSIVCSADSGRDGSRVLKGSSRHFLTPTTRKGLALSGRGQGGVAPCTGSEGGDMTVGILTLNRSVSVSASSSQEADSHPRSEGTSGATGMDASCTTMTTRRSLSASRVERMRPTAAFAPSSSSVRGGVRSTQCGVDVGIGVSGSLLCGVGVMQSRSLSPAAASVVVSGSDSRSYVDTSSSAGRIRVGRSDAGGIPIIQASYGEGKQKSRIVKGRPSMMARIPTSTPDASTAGVEDLQVMSSSASQAVALQNGIAYGGFQPCFQP